MTSFLKINILASIEAEPDHKGNIFETRNYNRIRRLTQQQHYFNLRNFPLI